jgi:hypothetical protein
VDASWRRDLARRVYVLCSFIDAKLDSAKIEIRRLSPGFQICILGSHFIELSVGDDEHQVATDSTGQPIGLNLIRKSDSVFDRF